MPNEMTPIEIAEYLEYQLNHTICMLDEDRDALEQAAKYMRKIASGELAEVKHASWDEKDYEAPHCSSCGEYALEDGSEEMIKSDYCPFCGALMGKDDSHG